MKCGIHHIYSKSINTICIVIEEDINQSNMEFLKNDNKVKNINNGYVINIIFI